MEGFLYPNEAIIQWTFPIVVYTYITGLVAGAFIVSALYHVFGIVKLKPVARFSLLTALAFLLLCPLPLLVHLGRIERSFEIFWTPNFSSAMASFAYIWAFYLVLLLSETWLAFRKDLVEQAKGEERGVKKAFYSVLALGVCDISEKTLERDEKVIKVLSAIGIPSACFLHGYVGFIFGAVKANPWWSSSLMPFIFLLSAIVSGIALLSVLYVIATKIRREPLDHDCLNTLGGWLLGFLLIDIAFEAMEVVSMLYESRESWEIISRLITQKLSLSYFGIQMVLGALIPIIILGAVRMGSLREGTKSIIYFVCSLLVLIGVFAMRWNVVIGGQLFSKSLRGFLSYSPHILGREGILSGVGLLILPLVILAILLYLLRWTPKNGVI